MTFRSLSHHTALTPGADLWILPNKTHSFWTKRLDWYLNFQISKPHPHPQISSQQRRQLQEWELPLVTTSLKVDLLMIASDNLLPNKQTVILPFIQKKWATWIQQAHHISINLKSPTLRLFLPDHYSFLDIKEKWPKTIETELSVVEFKKQRGL